MPGRRTPGFIAEAGFESVCDSTSQNTMLSIKYGYTLHDLGTDTTHYSVLSFGFHIQHSNGGDVMPQPPGYWDSEIVLRIKWR